MTLPVVDAGVEDWEEDVLDILTDDELARDVDVDLGIAGPGGKFPSCQGQGGKESVLVSMAWWVVCSV